MALPTTGQISISDIIRETARSNGDPNPTNVPMYQFSFNAAASNQYFDLNPSSTYKPNMVVPHTMSEWRGYDHLMGQQSVNVTLFVDVDSSNVEDGYVYASLNASAVVNTNVTIFIEITWYDPFNFINVVTNHSGVISSGTQSGGINCYGQPQYQYQSVRITGRSPSSYNFQNYVY